ncbi:MAG: hypothetical protein J6Y32_02485 [Bacteroidales bacterium]|nr:hypothetical protein [Bacteroidales bacterium]
MKKQSYAAPRAFPLLLQTEGMLLIQSEEVTPGYDQYHQGSGGYYDIFDFLDNGEY